jgi:hypothetical protein
MEMDETFLRDAFESRRLRAARQKQIQKKVIFRWIAER